MAAQHMQPRIFLRPAGGTGSYYSVHNFTTQAVDADVAPASSLRNFPPVYGADSYKTPYYNNTPDDTGYICRTFNLNNTTPGHSTYGSRECPAIEAAKQQSDDILARYMAEAILDNKRAMAAAGLLEPDKDPQEPRQALQHTPMPAVTTATVPENKVSSQRSSDDLRPVETVLHLSKMANRDISPDNQQYATLMASAASPSQHQEHVPDHKAADSMYSKTSSTLLGTKTPLTVEHITTKNVFAPVSNGKQKDRQRYSSQKAPLPDEYVHTVPTHSAEVFSKLLSTKKKKKTSRSSSRKRADDDTIATILEKNALMSKVFAESLRNYEYLVRKEKEMAQYAHFTTVLKNERTQAEQRECAQAQAIQLLLRRIGELEQAARQQGVIQMPIQVAQPPLPSMQLQGVNAPYNAYYPVTVGSQQMPVSVPVSLQQQQLLPSQSQLPTPAPLPHACTQPAQSNYYPQPPTLFSSHGNSGSIPTLQPCPDLPVPSLDSGHSATLHPSVVRNSQTPHAEATTFSLSKSASKMDPSAILSRSNHTFSSSLGDLQDGHDNANDVVAANEAVEDAAAIQRRLNFRSKMFTTIPPDPPSLTVKEQELFRPESTIYTSPPSKQREVTSPTVIQASALVKLLPTVATCVKKVPVTAAVSKTDGAQVPLSRLSILSGNKATIGATESFHKAEGSTSPTLSTSNEEVLQSVKSNLAALQSTSSDAANGASAVAVKVDVKQTVPSKSTSSSISYEAVQAPNIEYDTSVPYQQDSNKEADSPHALQVSYGKSSRHISSRTDHYRIANKSKDMHVKFVDQSSSSGSMSMSSASKASTVSVEILESDNETYQHILRTVHSIKQSTDQRPESGDTLLLSTGAKPNKEKFSLASTINVTAESPLFPITDSSKSAKSPVTNAIRSAINELSSSSREGATDKANRLSTPTNSSDSLLKLPNLSLDGHKSPSTDINKEALLNDAQKHRPSIDATSYMPLADNESNDDILSDFADLELELQPSPANSANNQSIGTASSLIETASNQASVFKRSLEEALKRSMDASLNADRASKGHSGMTISPQYNNELSIGVNKRMDDDYMDQYDSSFSGNQLGISNNIPDIPENNATNARGSFTATNLLANIRKSLSDLPFSSRHSINSAQGGPSNQNSALFPSMESQADYKLFLPNDSSIIGYQPDIEQPPDEFLPENPELFPSYSLNDVEGSAPSMPDQIVAQGPVDVSIDLDASKSANCTDDLYPSLEDREVESPAPGTDVPCVTLNQGVSGSHLAATGGPNSTQEEAVVFSLKKRGIGSSVSLASSSSISSPKRNNAAALKPLKAPEQIPNKNHNQNQSQSKESTFVINQRKLYGAATGMLAAGNSAQGIAEKVSSSSDDFNVASLSSKTESTSPLKPTQLGRLHFIPPGRQLAPQAPNNEGDTIKPVASESEPFPDKWAARPVGLSSQRQMLGADKSAKVNSVTDTLALNQRPKQDKTNQQHQRQQKQQSNPVVKKEIDKDINMDIDLDLIPDLNSTSISEERTLKDRLSLSSHMPTRFSVNADIDGFDNFYELNVELEGDSSNFDLL